MKPPLPLQYATSEKTETNTARWWLSGLLLAIGIAAWLSVGRAIIDWDNQVPALISGGGIPILMLIPLVRKMSVERMRLAQVKLPKPIRLTPPTHPILTPAY